LGQVNDSKTTFRKNDHELGAFRNEKDMIGCDHGQRVPIRQMDFKGLEWRFVADVLNGSCGHVQKDGGSSWKSQCERLSGIPNGAMLRDGASLGLDLNAEGRYSVSTQG
jgi:hypothetical protein